MKALTVGEVSNRIRQCPRQAIWSPKSRGRPKVHKQSAVARVRALFSDGLLVAPAARYNFGAKLEGMGNLEWGPEQVQRFAAAFQRFSSQLAVRFCVLWAFWTHFRRNNNKQTTRCSQQ